MFRFKVGDRVRLKSITFTGRADSFKKKIQNRVLTIDKFCTCYGCHRSSEGREVHFDNIGGYFCNEIDIELIEGRTVPKTEVDWLNQIQQNFKE